MFKSVSVLLVQVVHELSEQTQLSLTEAIGNS